MRGALGHGARRVRRVLPSLHVSRSTSNTRTLRACEHKPCRIRKQVARLDSGCCIGRLSAVCHLRVGHLTRIQWIEPHRYSLKANVSAVSGSCARCFDQCWHADACLTGCHAFQICTGGADSDSTQAYAYTDGMFGCWRWQIPRAESLMEWRRARLSLESKRGDVQRDPRVYAGRLAGPAPMSNQL